MFKRLVLFFMFYSFCCCSAPKSLVQEDFIPKKIKHVTLTVSNFSEKMLGIGSRADEILLFVYKEQDDGLDLVWSSEELIFDKDKKSKALAWSKALKKGDQYIFILVEKDTDLTIDEVLQKINNQAYPFEEDELKKELRDDDLLGVKRWSIDKMSAVNFIQFWGVHMLDEYEYTLKLVVE